LLKHTFYIVLQIIGNVFHATYYLMLTLRMYYMSVGVQHLSTMQHTCCMKKIITKTIQIYAM